MDLLTEHTSELVRSLVVIGVLAFMYLLVARLARGFIKRVAERRLDDLSRATTLWAMLRRLMLVSALTIGILTIANVWGFATGPFLAVGSAVGVALGFGAQDLVKDVIAGFFILAEDQYRIGDVIEIAGVSGVVEDIRPRVTVLRDLDGKVHYVPNGRIDVTTNTTQDFAQAVVDVTIGYGEDVDRVMAVIGDELDKMHRDPVWQEIILDAPQMLGVESLDDSAVLIRSFLKVQAEQRPAVRREALRRIKKRFDAEGIEIPFPQLSVHRRDG